QQPDKMFVRVIGMPDREEAMLGNNKLGHGTPFLPHVTTFSRNANGVRAINGSLAFAPTPLALGLNENTFSSGRESISRWSINPTARPRPRERPTRFPTRDSSATVTPLE